MAPSTELDQLLLHTAATHLRPLAGLIASADIEGRVSARSRVLCCGLACLARACYGALGGTRQIEAVGEAAAMLSLLTKIDDEVIDALAFHGGTARARSSRSRPTHACVFGPHARVDPRSDTRKRRATLSVGRTTGPRAARARVLARAPRSPARHDRVWLGGAGPCGAAAVQRSACGRRSRDRGRDRRYQRCVALDDHDGRRAARGRGAADRRARASSVLSISGSTSRRRTRWRICKRTPPMGSWRAAWVWPWRHVNPRCGVAR